MTTDIHAIIAAAQGDHEYSSMRQCPRCRSMDVLADHALAMAEALARIAAAGPEILRDGYRDTELDRVCIARECLDKIVKEAK